MIQSRTLAECDPQVDEIIKKEILRQQETLTLIPSENYASKAVLKAQGSLFTNKYAEGYPGKRYYRGCQWIDEIEKLAIERAKKLFKAEYVNVQVHSGTQANIVVYQALLNPGDTIFSLNLSHGGHLSHGKKGTFPYKYHRIVNYGVDRETEQFDYDEIRRLARKYRPHLIIVGASAYPRLIEFKPWRKIADEVGAYLLVDAAHIIGLIAAGFHPDPIPYADVVTATTQKTLRGPRGGLILCKKDFSDKIDKAVFPGTQGGPFIHIIAAKAVCFKEATEPEFKDYQHQIILNSKALANTLIEEGFRLVTGGTDNHLILADLSHLEITGERAAFLLEEAGIITNKNCIPFDPQPPSITSGIRLGTPALTTRGMKEPQLEIIGKWISEILHKPDKKNLRKSIKEKVKKLCQDFPIYKDL
ncbi:serine hydroxymethyltransferase [Candidatus Aerophobetes bacterium]|nr:serine hydroxymethyltransferase [Candidatus Aerophobetes bacterium]